MLTRDSFRGPWAGLPVAWNSEDVLDEKRYRRAIASSCFAAVPGVYSGGTTGEFYAMEWEEFQTISHVTVEECKRHNVPVMIGCTSTYTRGVIRRIEWARHLGADAVQVALPYWMEIGEPQILPFFSEIGKAAGDMAISIYETTRAKRVLSLDEHARIHEILPRYIMVKANAGTIGATPEGCAALSDFVNVFVGEGLWASLRPSGVAGCCSSAGYWNPRVVLDYWSMIEKNDTTGIAYWSECFDRLFQYLDDEFEPLGLTDTAYDRLGGVATGFLEMELHSRGPYPSATESETEKLRDWLQAHFPEMLEL